MLITFDTKKFFKALEAIGITVGGQAAVAVILQGKELMSSITVPDDSGPLDATVTFLDERGNPTTADDVPQWTSDNEAVATVAASEDGLSATVTVVGGLGAAVIGVSTTNDDGSTAQAQGTITVQPGDAAIGEVNFSSGT